MPLLLNVLVAKYFRWKVHSASSLPILPNAVSGKIKRFQNALHEKPLPRLALWNSFYSFKDIAALSKQAEERIRQGLALWDDKLHGLPLQEKILHFNFHHYLQNDLLVKVDRMSMRYGLEVRSPFLDKALAMGNKITNAEIL